MEYIMKNISKKKSYRNKKEKEEFNEIIGDIVKHKKVREMRNYNHHSNTNCFKHSMHVSYYNYKLCKLLNLDEKAGAKAGLLHDMFLYDWHQHKPEKGERLHGFEHPVKSLKNAQSYFKLTKKEGDIIAKHMFPLTITPPKYKETFIIILTDKFCSVCEVLDKYFNRK